ncbi:DUF2855 family protein [Pseudonocardia sp. TRM90224]|uniref:DUF2855 family protein n=1 Tax=Pseudonocardia sp. TRM90224 TaxID=2812678 RepID=UPI001E4CF5A6|nr:DUF2855 family protein [Pseudonocardia sp. TRM90224]
MTDFLVRRDDLRVWRTVESDPAPAPAAGEIQLRVERFGLTANNITYGAFGDQLGYWRFFAAPEGWGRIPIWGFGAVTASGVDGIAVGDRFYGYLPMSSTVTMRPHVDAAGFVEQSPARADLAVFYNRYLRALPELGFAPAHDDVNAIMRPLFMTGWLLADQLEEAGWHGAGAVVLASASSKTAFSTAFELAARSERPAVVGLTSPANLEFTRGLGCYDQVLTYDEVSTLPVEDGVVFVDMAGSPAVRQAVHEHAADALLASIAVGATHWESGGLGGGELPGPTPEFFFAPTRGEQRAAELGAGRFQQQVGAAWAAFADRLPQLLEIESGSGADALGGAYDAFLNGNADPRKGHVFTL